MQGEVWALIDCNNFFVSCERVFRPDLKNRPTLVLSSNDGCAVSRSNEVKSMGVPMGAPYFQYKEILTKHKTAIFSSNFKLYTNLSYRVMKTIAQFAPPGSQEIYSVDECFLRLTDRQKEIGNWEEFGLEIKQTVERQTGIPVTVGIAPSKTLAKLATEVAKKEGLLGNGVLSLIDWSQEQRQAVFGQTAINEIWGIGRQMTKSLLNEKVFTVADFLAQPLGWVQKLYKSNGEKIWRELQGESLIEDSCPTVESRRMMNTRSFGEPVTDLKSLQEAVATFVAGGAARLRAQKARASLLTVFIRTSHFIDPQQRFSASRTVCLEQATNFTPELATAAQQALKSIFQLGPAYKKAGIVLAGLEEVDCWQPALLTTQKTIVDEASQKKLMKVMDELNWQYGEATLKLGSQGWGEKKWTVKSDLRSPVYTHHWDQLRVVS